jgi:hypothetical protein
MSRHCHGLAHFGVDKIPMIPFSTPIDKAGKLEISYQLAYFAGHPNLLMIVRSLNELLWRAIGLRVKTAGEMPRNKEIISSKDAMPDGQLAGV